MFKKSKKTFFSGSSKGKKAFPGSFKGYKQKKQMKVRGKKQVKQMSVKKPAQFITQGAGHPGQKRQMYLVGIPRQPHYQMDQDIMERIRRATGG